MGQFMMLAALLRGWVADPDLADHPRLRELLHDQQRRLSGGTPLN